MDEAISEVMDQEEDLANQDINNVQGINREELTEEELKFSHFKELSSKNPQAAHNIMLYSYKDRKWTKNEETNHVVSHYSVDGDKMLMYMPTNSKDEKSSSRIETDEYREQEDYQTNKDNYNKRLLKTINAKIEN